MGSPGSTRACRRRSAAPTRASPTRRRSPTPAARRHGDRAPAGVRVPHEEHLRAQGGHNYWGYSPVGFCAPHAAYAASGARGGQVAEFRALVAALHEAGIEVILDVVYNHTAEGGPGETPGRCAASATRHVLPRTTT